ncbi:MAG TPA: NfeD family protein [Pirellulaceae bacterium]
MSPLAWSILLLVLGLVFLVLEFVIPSGGALGVLCALSFLAAIVVGFIAGPWTGTAMLLAVCLIVPLAVGAAVRWWPDTPFGKLMLVERPRSADEVLPETIAYRGLKDLVGRRGQSKGLMMPGGHVIIDGKTYDAVSEGQPIEPHQPVIVVGVSTQRVVVRADLTVPAQLADQPSIQPPADSSQPLIDDIPDPFAEEA